MLERFLCQRTSHGNEVSLFVNTAHGLEDPGFSINRQFHSVGDPMTRLAHIITGAKRPKPPSPPAGHVYASTMKKAFGPSNRFPTPVLRK